MLNGEGNQTTLKEIDSVISVRVPMQFLFCFVLLFSFI